MPWKALLTLFFPINSEAPVRERKTVNGVVGANQVFVFTIVSVLVPLIT